MRIVRKAVITAAGRGTRHFPATATIQKELFPLVDTDGLTKPVIQIVVEEAVCAGCEEVCVVVNPENAALVKAHFQPMPPDRRAAYSGKEWALEAADRLAEIGRRLTFVVQESAEGYGHAVAQAREFVAGEPALLMLGDHVYLSHTSVPCARQLLEVAERTGASVSAVQPAPAAQLHLFGAVAGEPLAGEEGVWAVTRIQEKPSPEIARRYLTTPGLPPETYLTFFGMHVLDAGIFDILADHIRRNHREGGEFQLTSAQEVLRQRGPYLACGIRGSRHDMGVPEGLVETQTALALRSPFAGVARGLAGGA